MAVVPIAIGRRAALGALALRRADSSRRSAIRAVAAACGRPHARRGLRELSPAPGRRVAPLGDGAFGEEPAVSGARDPDRRASRSRSGLSRGRRHPARGGQPWRVPRSRVGLDGHRFGRRALVRQLPCAGREPGRLQLPPWDGLSRRSSSRAPLKDLLPAAAHGGHLVRLLPPGARTGAAGDARARRLRGQSVLDVYRDRRALRERVPRIGAACSASPTAAMRSIRASCSRRSITAGASWCRAVRIAVRAPRLAATWLRASSAAPATTCGCSAPTRSAWPNAASTSSGLRNAYSEWAELGAARVCEPVASRELPGLPHVERFPACACRTDGEGERDKPSGHSDPSARAPRARASSRARPASLPRGRVATASARAAPVHPHYFSGRRRAARARVSRRARRRTLARLAPVFRSAPGSAATCCSAAASLDARPRADPRRAARVTRSRSKTSAPVIASRRASARSASSGCICA